MGAAWGADGHPAQLRYPRRERSRRREVGRCLYGARDVSRGRCRRPGRRCRRASRLRRRTSRRSCPAPGRGQRHRSGGQPGARHARGRRCESWRRIAHRGRNGPCGGDAGVPVVVCGCLRSVAGSGREPGARRELHEPRGQHGVGGIRAEDQRPAGVSRSDPRRFHGQWRARAHDRTARHRPGCGGARHGSHDDSGAGGVTGRSERRLERCSGCARAEGHGWRPRDVCPGCDGRRSEGVAAVLSPCAWGGAPRVGDRDLGQPRRVPDTGGRRGWNRPLSQEPHELPDAVGHLQHLQRRQSGADVTEHDPARFGHSSARYLADGRYADRERGAEYVQQPGVDDGRCEYHGRQQRRSRTRPCRSGRRRCAGHRQPEPGVQLPLQPGARQSGARRRPAHCELSERRSDGRLLLDECLSRSAVSARLHRGRAQFPERQLRSGWDRGRSHQR